MGTLLITHTDCLNHLVPPGHPERPARLEAILKALAPGHFPALKREEAPEASREALLRVHDPAHVEAIFETGEKLRWLAREGQKERLAQLDPDTWMSPGSLRAALRAAGAVVRAVEAVARGEAANAFCAVRPPGHHAEVARAMGFCLFNNVVVGAAYALEVLGLSRVAIMDFDVHHGNGTQAIFWNEPRVMYLSTHQMPAYPGTGTAAETGAHGNVVNCPLPPETDGHAFREAVESRILPALDRFRPELLLISAGFDAHAADPLAALSLREEDFAWITLRLAQVAAEASGGRIVSVLEGGYDLVALAASVAAHVRVLADAGGGRAGRQE
jgi:acetoin utilization deacetylase AcuC-like enzyme